VFDFPGAYAGRTGAPALIESTLIIDYRAECRTPLNKL
jgi:hypothetical protein